jgi:hypothetical protein
MEDTKFFVGLPASKDAAAKELCVLPEDLNAYLKSGLSFSNMADAILWDASQSWANNNYHDMSKEGLKAAWTLSVGC